jgi:hypothetical protein
MRTIRNIWKFNRFLLSKALFFKFWYYYWTVREAREDRSYAKPFKEVRWYRPLFSIRWIDTQEGQQFWARVLSLAQYEYHRKNAGL